ncbi:hypothetical protein [Devosia sp. LjRoot3]|uniref:hypothetical protein n=1 Tax=Devosia sp. LjRoot3 TaxID=3342319 RepID=UPI003ECF29B2
MLKFATLTLLAGVLTATTVLPSTAAVMRPRPPAVETSSGSTPECSAAMGHMRSVKQADIAAIHGQDVVLLPVCEELAIYGRNGYGSLFVEGNVNHLRQPIAHSATLMAALTAKGYDQNDVVSLRQGGNDSIILYVYQRDTR